MYSLPKQNIKSCNAKRQRQREWWKNNSRSNQQKRNFALAAHSFCIFLCRCFARIQRVTCRHLLASYTFYGGNVLRLVHLFLMPFIYVLVAHFLITASKLSCCFSNKKMSPLFFIPRCCTVALFLVELRWPVAYFLFFSVFTFLYIHSKFVDMTINLSLKL